MLAAASAVMIGIAAFPANAAAADAAAATTAAPTPIPVASNQLPGWPQRARPS